MLWLRSFLVFAFAFAAACDRSSLRMASDVVAIDLRDRRGAAFGLCEGAIVSRKEELSHQDSLCRKVGGHRALRPCQKTLGSRL